MQAKFTANDNFRVPLDSDGFEDLDGVSDMIRAGGMASRRSNEQSVAQAPERTLARRVASGVSTALMAIAIVLAVALVGVRLIGFDVYAVLSGSMEPTYKTGSVIYVQSCEADDVQVGDPITFVLNEDLVVATHRVVSIDEDAGAFTTKGDANSAIDGSPVLFENLLGKPVFTIPYLGYLVAYIQEPPGTYVAIAVCALLVMIAFLPDLFAKDAEEGPAGGRKGQRAGAGSKNMARGKHARMD